VYQSHYEDLERGCRHHSADLVQLAESCEALHTVRLTCARIDQTASSQDHRRTALELLACQQSVSQRLVVDADADLLYTRWPRICPGLASACSTLPSPPCHRRSRKSTLRARRLQQANMSHRLERHQHRGAATVHGFRPTGSGLQCRVQTKSVISQIPVAHPGPGR